MRRSLPRGGGLLAVALALAPLPAAAAPDLEVDTRPYHETGPDRPVLALTPGLEGAEFGALLDRLEHAGLNLPIAIPGAGVVIRDRGAVDDALALEPAVTRVLRGPGDADAALSRAAGPTAETLFLWWNGGFEDPAGRLERRRLERAALGVPDPDPSLPLCGGAMTYERALVERGESFARRCGMNDEFSRVHFAAGRFVMNLIYPDYVGGPGWDPDDLAMLGSHVLRAANWWNLKSGGRATFVIRDYGTVPVQVDPATLTMGEEDLYIGQAMDWIFAAGGGGPCPFDSVDLLNQQNRDLYGAHWGYTQFCLNADNFVGRPALAYAWVGGPHTVCLRGNGGFTQDALAQVVAHEMGHIFQAMDEYASGCAGCTPRSGYLNVENGNCEHCFRRVGSCIMRGASEYSDADREHMETAIHPCDFTRGQVGLWDKNPADGVLDVMATIPETEMYTVFADTLDGSLNVPASGKAWDLPFAGAASGYEAVTINTIRRVEFSVDGSPWSPARPLDGFFTEREEEWELRLPELGGGAHQLSVRAVNSVLAADPTPVTTELFVYDVMLLRDVELVRQGSRIALIWRIDGDDFGSPYTVHRRHEGHGEMMPIASVASDGRRNQEFVWWDDEAVPGQEYTYRVDVDIEGKGVKTLGIVRGEAVLAEPSAGRLVRVGPNPSRGPVLFTVDVPRGPRPSLGDPSDPNADPGDGDGIRPSSPAGRDGPGDGGGNTGGDSDPPLWRDVRAKLYDVTGRLVQDFGTERRLETTRFNLTWDGTDRGGRRVPPGVYFLRVDLGYTRDLAKVVVLR